MTTLAQVAKVLQILLTTRADDLARSTGFVKRESKLTGARFAQALVFGWMRKPGCSVSELAQMAGVCGVRVSPQGIDDRWSEHSAEFVRRMLGEAVGHMVGAAQPVAIALLSRFTHVWVQDGTTVSLPDELAGEWRGCGGSTNGTLSALKALVRLDLRTGRMLGPLLQPGRAQDRSSALQREPVESGSLWLADLGFFTLGVFERLADQGAYFLSRLRAGVVVRDEAGNGLDLVELLARDGGVARVEMPVLLGTEGRVGARLIAVRLPQGVTNERRRKLRVQAKKKGQAPSRQRLALADYNIYVTNAPEELLGIEDALVLARARWQVEMLFKLWKSHGRVDEWRTSNPWRILTEVYAKLLVMLVEHWLMLVGCWSDANRSPTKAVQAISACAFALAGAVRRGGYGRLREAIELLVDSMGPGTRMNTRRNKPNAYQLLHNPSLASLPVLA